MAVHILEQVMVPVRDGVRLATDILLPDAAGGPWPVLLSRSAYGFGPPAQNEVAHQLAAWDYAVVMQDVRGRGRSEGHLQMEGEGEDGYDTLAWLRTQPWCIGQIGMRGPSYLAAVQFAAACLQPPGLTCLFAPLSAPQAETAWRYPRWWAHGGALSQSRMQNWLLRHGAAEDPHVQRNESVQARLAAAMAALPRWGPTASDALSQAYAVFDTLANVPSWADILPLQDWPVLQDAPRAYAAWRQMIADLNSQPPAPHPDDPHRIAVPAYLVAGWFDLFLGGTLANFQALVAHAPDERTAHAHRLLICPTGHAGYAWGRQPFCGEIAVGPAAQINELELERRWFDHWLQRPDPTFAAEPPVRYYTLGANAWRTAGQWPPGNVTYTPYYFHGPAGRDVPQSNARGGLSRRPPTWDPPQGFVYDPHRPVPTRGGDALWLPWGSYDQRPVTGEARDDVLSFTGEPLTAPLEVTGHVQVVLYAASSAADTDFTAKLIDVYPDGRMLNVRDGILRARYRHGTNGAPALLVPGEIYHFEIDLLATSYLFFPGHRLRVDIASSNFPQFDRNANTGQPIGTDGRDDLTVARQTVFHDALRPSHLLLPLMPRTS